MTTARVTSTLDRSYIVLKKLLCLIVSTGILTGCATSLVSKETVALAPAWDSTYVAGELNGESLYDLLIAELAGHQQQYDVSLEKYLKQAELTGDPGIIRRAARIAQFTENPDALEKAARIWIQYEPASNEPQALLAGLLIHRKEFKAALPFVKKTFSTENHQILALLNASAGKIPPDATQMYLEMLIQQLKISPRYADLWLTRGIFERHQANPEAALKSFSKAIRFNPDAEIAVLQKADLLKEMGRYNDALKITSSWLKNNPENKQLILIKIQTLYKADKSKSATQESYKLISDFSEDDQLHLYLALLALDFNRLDDSKAMLQTLLKRTGDSALYFYLGLIAEQSNQPEQAIEHYLQVNSGSNILQSYTRSIALLNGATNEQRIAGILDQAIVDHPELGPDLVNLHADWLRSSNLTQSAIRRISEGLATYPDNLPLRYSRAMLRPPEDFSQSEEDFRFILKKDPDNAMALNALGYTLSLYTQRYDEAYALLNKAIQIKPEDPAIMDSIGWVLFKLQRHEEALNFLKKAYEIYPDAEVGSHLISVLITLNKRDKAQEIFAEISSKFPDNPHVTTAQNVINAQK
ncbi:tetratricopeptide repeat protein [Neptunomonas antarctica]|uniref:Tetratricopeptide repeat-containing protein n=1 Tax=Neptunomonas antarctica TaxID=619304 RepID=A0A1N7N4U2_9GAMM|nr:tetratricopeptide repeat protein [Neptunomonas antarctica]SIS93397.1 Tetratricopeptide repeat-containing protein [Neptunomonas antarctica]